MSERSTDLREEVQPALVAVVDYADALEDVYRMFIHAIHDV